MAYFLGLKSSETVFLVGTGTKASSRLLKGTLVFLGFESKCRGFDPKLPISSFGRGCELLRSVVRSIVSKIYGSNIFD